MHTLVLYAPFDFGFEIDIRSLLSMSNADDANSLAATLGDMASGMQDKLPGVHWTPGAQRSNGDGELVVGYGGEYYRAPFKRPPFLFSVDIDTGNEHAKAMSDLAGGQGLAFHSMRAVLHDYGICVLELRLDINPDAASSHPSLFASRIGDLCQALPAGTVELCKALASRVSLAVSEHRLAFADDSTSLVHRGCHGLAPEEIGVRFLWTHSLVIADNRDGSLGLDGCQEWCRDVESSGVLPKNGHFYCDALSYQCVHPSLYVTRDMVATAIFGWGNSLVVLSKGDPRTDYEPLIPIQYVMMTLQSQSAGLFILNSDLLGEVLRETGNMSGLKRGEYNRRHETINNLRFRADLYLSLMEEQRYNQSAHERVLWDAATMSWDTASQTSAIQRNIELLQKLYGMRKSRIEEHIRKKVTVGVTAITVASAASVGFEIANTLLEGPDWPKLEFELLILVALLVFAVTLFMPPRK